MAVLQAYWRTSSVTPAKSVLVHDSSRPSQPKMVVYSVTEFLFAGRAAFHPLYRDVAQKKLNLFQFATCTLAQTCTGAA
jgi:hypothetical protein